MLRSVVQSFQSVEKVKRVVAMQRVIRKRVVAMRLLLVSGAAVASQKSEGQEEVGVVATRCGLVWTSSGTQSAFPAVSEAFWDVNVG